LAILGVSLTHAAQKPNLPLRSPARLAVGEEVNRVEIKLSCDSAHIDQAVKAFELKDADANRRVIHFFDSKNLGLFQAGIILRARQSADTEAAHGDKAETTVKLRPLARSQVRGDWFKLDDFKCETDSTGQRTIDSCSLDQKVKTADLIEVLQGKAGEKKVFGEKQEEFVSEYRTVRVDWDRSEPLGPIASRTWKLKFEGFTDPVAIELWDLSADLHLMEISTRADAGQVDQITAKLKKLLETRGVRVAADGETKTRTALEYFASKK
jgi:hypothetical protein